MPRWGHQIGRLKDHSWNGVLGSECLALLCIWSRIRAYLSIPAGTRRTVDLWPPPAWIYIGLTSLFLSSVQDENPRILRTCNFPYYDLNVLHQSWFSCSASKTCFVKGRTCSCLHEAAIKRSFASHSFKQNQLSSQYRKIKILRIKLFIDMQSRSTRNRRHYFIKLWYAGLLRVCYFHPIRCLRGLFIRCLRLMPSSSNLKMPWSWVTLAIQNPLPNLPSGHEVIFKVKTLPSSASTTQGEPVNQNCRDIEHVLKSIHNLLVVNNSTSPAMWITASSGTARIILPLEGRDRDPAIDLYSSSNHLPLTNSSPHLWLSSSHLWLSSSHVWLFPKSIESVIQ